MGDWSFDDDEFDEAPPVTRRPPAGPFSVPAKAPAAKPAAPARDLLTLSAMGAAAAALARLDTRLTLASQPVRDGWRARFLFEEASASARLEGDWSDAQDLMLAEAGALEGPPGPHLSATLRVLDMVRLAARRHPRSFWTPGRLARLASALPQRGESGAGFGARFTEGADPTRAWEALQRALTPARIEEWQHLGPLLGAADILRVWNAHGLDALLGGAPGRILAAAWPWRLGETHSLTLPVAWGFVGHAQAYAPGSTSWDRQFLEAAARGVGRAGDLLDRLLRAEQRLLQATLEKRSNSRLAALAALLLARPATGSSEIARVLNTSKQGALNLLQELLEQGLVREISGRRSFRIWTAALL